MKDFLPLCLSRIWCRRNEAWLSFKTIYKDRYLVNPDGYFLELPDGSLTRISPHTTFPVINGFPSLVVSEIAARTQFGPDAYFVSVPVRTQQQQEPAAVDPDDVFFDPFEEMQCAQPLEPLEHYILLRAVENGFIPLAEVPRVLGARERSGNSVGEILISSNICHWETLLAQCLDIRPPSRLDPPNLRMIIERREWELIGEILVSMDFINRTELEHALKIKREGSQALGQILTAMGACTEQDIHRCLQIQEQLKHVDQDGVVLIGKLMVGQGVIADSDLEEMLWKQRVARQPLGRILVSMGACAQREIDQYEALHTTAFQQAVDEASMADYLLKTDTINKVQLEEALRLQSRGRQVLGEMLVALGMCSREQVQNAVELQQEVREAYRSGLQRLGDLLIKKGKVSQSVVEEALRLQSIGRQPFGSILVAMGACTPEQVNLALEVQYNWRALPQEPGDRLGEVLVKQGILTEDQLEAPFYQHLREEKPLGRILIENKICTPEQIIGALITRDTLRQQCFINYVRAHVPGQPANGEAQQAAPIALNRTPSGTFASRISNLFGKSKQKS